MREALVFVPNGIGRARQRQMQRRLKLFRVRHVAGHFAQPVHVVGKSDQARRRVSTERLERAADHGRAHHLAECPDMRQAGRAVAGLEQGRSPFSGSLPFSRLRIFAGFFKWPRFRLLRERRGAEDASGSSKCLDAIGHGFRSFLSAEGKRRVGLGAVAPRGQQRLASPRSHRRRGQRLDDAFAN